MADSTQAREDANTGKQAEASSERGSVVISIHYDGTEFYNNCAWKHPLAEGSAEDEITLDMNSAVTDCLFTLYESGTRDLETLRTKTKDFAETIWPKYRFELATPQVALDEYTVAMIIRDQEAEMDNQGDADAPDQAATEDNEA